MAIEDDIEGLYSNSVMLNDYKLWPEDGSDRFSWHRWYEYDALFKRLGTATHHMLTTKASREWSMFPPRLLQPNPMRTTQIDSVKKATLSVQRLCRRQDDSLDGLGVDDLGITYRRIDEHWYLYHDCGIGKPVVKVPTCRTISETRHLRLCRPTTR